MRSGFSQTLPCNSLGINLSIVPVKFISVIIVSNVSNREVIVTSKVIEIVYLLNSAEGLPFKSNLLVSLCSSRSIHLGGSRLHNSSASVISRWLRPSIGVISGSSNSDLFSSSNTKSLKRGHGYSAGVDGNIATTKAGKRSALSTSASRAYLDVVTGNRRSTVSRTRPGDVDGAFNSSNSDYWGFRSRSESDLEDLRFGVSTLRGSLDVESVESSVTDGDGSRVSEDRLVLNVLSISGATLIPPKFGLGATTVLPGEVDLFPDSGESDGLSEGRRSRRKSKGLSNSRSSTVNSTSGSVGDSEAVAVSSTVLGEVSLGEGARVGLLVSKVVEVSSSGLVGTATLGKSSPSSVGVNLNVVSLDASRASSLSPGEDGIASSRSSNDGRRSRLRSDRVSSRLRPDSSRASVGTDSEVDRVSALVSINSTNTVKREAERVSISSHVVSHINVLVLETVSRAVL